MPGPWLSSKRQPRLCRSWLKRKGKKVKWSWGEQLRYQKGLSPPLQVAGETPGGRLLRSTNIGFWIRVRFKAALASGNQFRHSCLFFLLTACAKHTDLVAARTRLWIHHHHQPSSFYLLALQQACLGCSVVSCKTSLPQLFYSWCKTSLPRLFCSWCCHYFI